MGVLSANVIIQLASQGPLQFTSGCSRYMLKSTSYSFLDDVLAFYVPLSLFYIVGPRALELLICIFVVCYFFSKSIFRNTIKVSNIWSQIRPDKTSGLIRVQAVCKDYQQTTLVGKKLNFHTAASDGARGVILLV